jgi:hypothetical protein
MKRATLVREIVRYAGEELEGVCVSPVNQIAKSPNRQIAVCPCDIA